MLRPYLSRVRPCTGPDPAQFDHMRTDFDAELVREHLAHRAAGHSGHRFPGARALQDVARVLAVVLEGAREIRVARPRTRHLAAPLAPGGVRFGGHHVLPVLPIAIPHEHRDGGAERLAGPHAREPLDLVGFDLHAGAAAVAAHPPLQLDVDAVGGQGQPGGDPLEDRHQAAPVRLARCGEPKGHATEPPSEPPPTSTNLHEPPDNSTRARLRVGLVISPFVPLSTSWRGGQGVRPHGRGGACGLVFVMVGSETTTSPRVVMPNRYCWPLVASNATRSGPMIGSRIEIFRCWLKKNV